MFIHSWQVFTLPKFRIQSEKLCGCCPKFDPWGISEAISPPAAAPASTNAAAFSGSTVWGCQIDGSLVCVAWEWISVRPRVIAMGDPMTIFSNLDLIGSDGQRIDDSQHLLKLHELIFALPWQSHVTQARWPVEQRLAA